MTLDGDRGKQDSSLTEDTSASLPGQTSEKEPETFTREAAYKLRDDALSAAGRDAKTLGVKTEEVNRIIEDTKKIRDELQAERGKLQKEKDDAFLEEHRDDQDAVDNFRTKLKQRDKDAELAERERKSKEREEGIEAKVEQIRVFNRTQLAAEVAVAKNVSIDAILKLTQDDSREAMEATADLLPKKDVAKTLEPDSGRTIGGGGKTEEQRYKERYPKM